MEKTQRIIVGTTGEHYVAAYLSGMGLIVSLTRGGTEDDDPIHLLLAETVQSRPQELDLFVDVGNEAQSHQFCSVILSSLASVQGMFVVISS